MVVEEEVLHVVAGDGDAGLLVRLADRRTGGVLVGVDGTTGQRPCPAAVGPRSPQLQQHERAAAVQAHEQQAGGAETTPVRLTARAPHEPVSVAHSHALIVPAGAPVD